MSAAIANIKSHLAQSLLVGGGVTASRLEAMTLSEMLAAHNQNSREEPISVLDEHYRALVNELRADLMGLKNADSEAIQALPTISAWADEGMGLAHSFNVIGREQVYFVDGQESSSFPREQMQDSLLEEMWHYLPTPITQALPDCVMRGMLSYKGMVGEFSRLGRNNLLSLGVLIAKSSPHVLDMKAWRLWEDQDKEKPKKGAKKVQTNTVLPWLPVLSFAVLGKPSYFASLNFTENRSRISASEKPFRLMAMNLRHMCDLELFDQYVVEVREGWSTYQTNEILKGVIDTNFFWSSRDRKITDEIKDFWLSKAHISLAGDPAYAAWTVNLLGSLYAKDLPNPTPDTLDDRFRHLNRMLKQFPQTLPIYEYMNEHQPYAQDSAEGDSENQIWADEAFLSPLDEDVRGKWLEALSRELSEKMLSDYKHGRRSAAIYEPSQIRWFFRARHPRMHQLLCDKLLKAISISTMEKTYPKAGSSLLEIATYDLQRPERRADAVALINGTRSSKWKVFLVNHLGIPAAEVNLTSKQRDSVFSHDLGL